MKGSKTKVNFLIFLFKVIRSITLKKCRMVYSHDLIS